MGVKECSRNSCMEIMCDRYSHVHGYICNECFRELRDGGYRNIDAFMESKKEFREAVSDHWAGLLDEIFASQDLLIRGDDGEW